MGFSQIIKIIFSQIIVTRNSNGHQRRVNIPDLVQSLQNPALNTNLFCTGYLTDYTLALDGPRRIELVNTMPAGDQQLHSNSSLGVLFQDNAKREEVRRIVKDAFGFYFVIDPTNLGHFRIRISNRAPSTVFSEERGIDDPSIQFHKEAAMIDAQSDGVKAFIGIVMEIVAGNPHVVLIDEPEAFLHPS